MAIAPLGLELVDQALGLLRRQGWAYARRDVVRAVELDPGGNPTATEGGRVVGLALTAFNGSWGFLGAVVVRPADRGRGLGTALVGRAVDHLKDRGADTVGLEAAKEREEFYRPLGFTPVGSTLHMEGSLGKLRIPSQGVRRMLEEDIATVAAFDGPLFGGDRMGLLRRLRQDQPRLAYVGEERGEIWGFILGRGGRTPHRLGPWVAREGHPRALDLGRAIGGSVSLSVPGEDRTVVQDLEASGLEVLATLTRMFIGGREPPQVKGAILATGGPEKG